MDLYRSPFLSLHLSLARTLISSKGRKTGGKEDAQWSPGPLLSLDPGEQARRACVQGSAAEFDVEWWRGLRTLSGCPGAFGIQDRTGASGGTLKGGQYPEP